MIRSYCECKQHATMHVTNFAQSKLSPATFFVVSSKFKYNVFNAIKMAI